MTAENGTFRESTELRAVQEWMLEAVTTSRNGDPELVEQMILPSEKLTASERLRIYEDAYVARLVECLSDEFAALKHALGDEAFGAFAGEYLQAQPSRNASLAELGAGFPGFLKATRPADLPTPSWPDFLIDLATVERCYADVFDGPGHETQPVTAASQMDWNAPEDCRFVPSPSLRLLTLNFPAHEFISAVRRGENPECPAAQLTPLVVFRRDYVVRRVVISASEMALLTELANGVSLGNAVRSVADQIELSDDELAAQLEVWFREWTTAGWLRFKSRESQ